MTPGSIIAGLLFVAAWLVLWKRITWIREELGSRFEDHYCALNQTEACLRQAAELQSQRIVNQNDLRRTLETQLWKNGCIHRPEHEKNPWMKSVGALNEDIDPLRRIEIRRLEARLERLMDYLRVMEVTTASVTRLERKPNPKT